MEVVTERGSTPSQTNVLRFVLSSVRSLQRSAFAAGLRARLVHRRVFLENLCHDGWRLAIRLRVLSGRGHAQRAGTFDQQS